MLKKILRNSKGQGMVEYILIIALVVGVIVGVFALFGEQIGEIFKGIMDRIRDSAGL